MSTVLQLQLVPEKNEEPVINKSTQLQLIIKASKPYMQCVHARPQSRHMRARVLSQSESCETCPSRLLTLEREQQYRVVFFNTQLRVL